MTDDIDTTLDAIHDAYTLKSEPRAGWVLRGIDDPETVAAHLWGTAVLALAFADRAGVDPERAVRVALLHDITEAELGDRAIDAPETDHDSDEWKREQRDCLDAFETFPMDVATHWEEHEYQETPTGRFVHDMGLIDMCLQATAYAASGRGDHHEEFFDTTDRELRTEVGRTLFEQVREQYESLG